MHLVIEGRNYEFPEKLKLGEIRLIKQVAGVGMNQIMGALEDGDPNVIAAFVLIVMRRAGRRIELEQIDELEITEINFGEDDSDTPELGKDADVAAAAAAAAGNGSPATTPPTSGPPRTPTTSTSPHPTWTG